MTWVEKQTTHVKLTFLLHSSCETLLSWLTNPVFQPEGVSPGRTVPVVPRRPFMLELQTRDIFQENPKNHCCL